VKSTTAAYSQKHHVMFSTSTQTGICSSIVANE